MSAPAGWHRQPDGRERYWDGVKWTDHFRDAQPPSAGAAFSQPQALKPVRPWYKKKRYVIPAGLVALSIIGSALPDSEDSAVPASAVVAAPSVGSAAPATTSTPTPTPSSTAATPTTTSAPAPVKPKAPATVKPKAPAPVKPKAPAPVPVKPKPAAPVESMSQANARAKAADYLDYSAFSRKGLIEQLKFEGFSTKDATYGVDALKVNWNKQAALKAADYLDYTSFSRSGLIEQLEFDGFTPSQAQYGVKSTGL